VEEEVVDRGIRGIFPHSGVDTADADRWQMVLQFHAMMDEFVVGMYADHVRAAQEGLFDRQLVFGTISYSFRGVPIPGELTKRKRPRCRLEVDPITQPVVLQIFRWYVRERLSQGEIVRRLNDLPGIPLPPKCNSGAWTYQAVHDLLANPRYRGYWEYGKTQTRWQSKKDYARQILRDKPLRAAQIEELRIVPDDLRYGAAQRLAEEDRSAVGRKPRDGNRQSRPRLLHGLFRCPTHDQILYVGGVHGRYMFCKACKGLPVEKRPLYSQLPRQLALELTCQKLATLVEQDEGLVSQIIVACQAEAERAQQPDPTRIEALGKKEQQLTRKIEFVMQNPGETEADRRESAANLKGVRGERAAVRAEISLLEAGSSRTAHVPDAAEVRVLLSELDRVFAAASRGDLQDENGTAREILLLLTGGRIDLYQRGERRSQRGWLQGRCRIRLLANLVQRAVGVEATSLADPGTEIIIDYRKPSSLDGESERAKDFADQGLMHCQIAARMGCGRNWVTKLLEHWYTSRGLEMLDGRKRRKGLTRKQLDAPMYEQLAEPAKGLWDEGMADLQIAEQLGCSPPTAVAAIDYWHTARGLTAPSHAERRAALIDRMLVLYDAQRYIRDVAREVGMCTRSVTLLLRERLKSLGRPMVDGRKRRAMLECNGQETEESQAETNEPPRTAEG
jgi:hypothetical protein